MNEQGIITCTAWDCMGEYYHLVDNTHLIRIAGGREFYAMASTTRNNTTVRLSRLIEDGSGRWGLRQINRYVPYNTKVEIVPIKNTGDVL